MPVPRLNFPIRINQPLLNQTILKYHPKQTKNHISINTIPVNSSFHPRTNTTQSTNITTHIIQSININVITHIITFPPHAITPTIQLALHHPLISLPFTCPVPLSKQIHHCSIYPMPKITNPYVILPLAKSKLGDPF
jgi:hypothetical protein